MRDTSSPKVSDEQPRSTGSLKWETSVPIFTHPIIMRQIALAIGLPFGIIAVILLLTTRNGIANGDWIYALYLVGALFILTFILIMAVYGGRYAAGFVVDGKGVLCYTQKRHARRSAIINRLAVVLGLLSRNYSAAGAGMLAQSRQSVLVPWKQVRRVKYHPARQTILIYGGFGQNIALFCTRENYDNVEAAVRSRLKK